MNTILSQIDQNYSGYNFKMLDAANVFLGCVRYKQMSDETIVNSYTF